MDAEAHLAGTGAINIYVQFTLNNFYGNKVGLKDTVALLHRIKEHTI